MQKIINFFISFDSEQCDLNNNYRLILNKYNVVSNHVLIITKQFISQNEILNKNDFEIIFNVINSINGLAFFNSGINSGASQLHKHIQIIPRNKELMIERLNLLI